MNSHAEPEEKIKNYDSLTREVDGLKHQLKHLSSVLQSNVNPSKKQSLNGSLLDNYPEPIKTVKPSKSIHNVSLNDNMRYATPSTANGKYYSRLKTNFSRKIKSSVNKSCAKF